MKFLSRLLSALLTFVIGVSGTSWWYLLRREPALKVPSLSKPTINGPVLVEETTDTWAHEQGVYFNPEYGYSLTIPDGLIGYRSPVPLPQHGFAIDLSKPDDAHVWIDGAYNAAEWASLKDAAKDNLNYLNAHNVSDIRVTSLTYGRLSRLRAVRIVVTYNKSGLSMIEDEIIALRKERDVVYTLQLQTTADRYSDDVKLLNQLQRTFRLEPLPYP
jgi:hypothetical protein